MIGVCIHCVGCAGEHKTEDWCLIHGREMRVLEDGYVLYLGRATETTCDKCGRVIKATVHPTNQENHPNDHE